MEKVIKVLSVTTALLLAVSGVLQEFLEIYNRNLKED